MSSVAVEHVEAAAGSCRSAFLAQGTASVDHADFYGLAGNVVDVLRALDALTGVLVNQVGRYADGRRIYDDQGEDPAERLTVAVAQLGEARAALSSTEAAFDAFWSSIGHIGVEVER